MDYVQLELNLETSPVPPSNEPEKAEYWLTDLTSRPFSNYLSALGLLRLVPKLKGCWQGNRFGIDTPPEEVISILIKNYQPSPIFTPWNKAGGWLVQEKKANAKHIQILRNSTCERFAKIRASIEVIDRVYQETSQNGFFTPKGEYSHPDLKSKFVTQLRRLSPDDFVQWIDVVYAFMPETIKAIPLAGKAGSEGTGEYSKTFCDALFTVFEANGNPKPECELGLKVLLLGENAPTQSKISPGLFDPSAGGLNRRFIDGSKFDPTINPWSVLLFMEGLLAFASQTTNKLDGLDSGSAVVPFAVRASNVGYSTAADEGFKLELWVPLWSQFLTAKKLSALFRRGRSRLDDKPVKDGLQFARSLPQLADRTGIERLERYGIIERASEKGNTWACHLGTFFTNQKDVAIIAQAERWVNAYSKASNSRTLKERYFQTLTGQRRLEDFVIDLGESFVKADRSPQKFGSLQQPYLGSSWAERLLDENNSTEVRLAIALSQAWSFRGNEKASKILRWTESDLTNALITANREWVIRSSQNQAPSRSGPHVRLEDLTKFLYFETDDRQIWALTRGLRAVQAYGVNWLEETDSKFYFPPGFEAIAICWNWCELWRKHDRVPHNKQTFVYEGQILMGLISGQETTTKTAIATALRRLRTAQIYPTLKDGYSLKANIARRWATALAFPLADQETQKLIYSLTEYSKPEKQ